MPMSSLTFELSEQSRSFIQEQAAAEGFPTPGAYLDALVRQVQLKKAKLELEAKFREALASGPGAPMTREDWEVLERNVWERHRQETAKP
jgi:antitoxin ParD1/3/4